MIGQNSRLRGEPRLGSSPFHSPLRHSPPTMLDLYDQIQEAKQAIQSRWSGTPRVGIILGTGLGGLTEDIDAEAKLAYGDIPHFPHSTSPSHAGRLVCGRLAGKAVIAMEGRFHYYEGYSLKQITL